ncbi:MAG: hydrogenase expression/formation protein HypE [archaeon]|nr:hydrogenase expression/formation protein HypE [archaeon]
MKNKKEFNLSCPIPLSNYPQILLAHGGGARLTNNLIEKMFKHSFNNSKLESQHDGAVFEIDGKKFAFSTDSFVINPIFFPGGDIGMLAVNGTVNDLAMCGAKPLYLSVGFIIEEGFQVESLWKIVQSMQQAAKEANVELVTGDTKVVDNGKGDGIFINTSGIGIIEHNVSIMPSNIEKDDVIIINGDVGRHGTSIMAVRQGLEFETKIESDCTSLSDIVKKLLDSGISIHCMRDLTRGGLATALVEIAEKSNKHIHILEQSIPVSEEVHGACEMLGLDPLYVANEGRFIAIVKQKDAQKALEIMKSHSNGKASQIIGKVDDNQQNGFVTMQSKIGANRIIDMLSGEQLPRIC